MILLWCIIYLRPWLFSSGIWNYFLRPIYDMAIVRGENLILCIFCIVSFSINTHCEMFLLNLKKRIYYFYIGAYS